MLNAPVGEPFVRIERQDKAEHVLKNEHASEGLNSHLT